MSRSPQTRPDERSSRFRAGIPSPGRALALAFLAAAFGGAAFGQTIPEAIQEEKQAAEESAAPSPEAAARKVPLSAVLEVAQTVSQISSLSPPSGPASGGSGVTIRGNFFQPGATVQVGGLPATVLSIPSTTQINVAMPALAAGALYDVVVTNTNGSKGTLPAAWFADFADEPASDGWHDYVEQLVRDGVTGGCGGGNYCPNNGVTRAQMAVFILRSEHGPTYTPPPAKGTVFADVPIGSFAAAWIEQLAAESITGGCGGGNYCPAAGVTIEQMAVFLLKAEHGATYNPPAPAGTYPDLPPTSGFAAWGEQLAREGVYLGSGGGNFGTGLPVTRGIMAALLTRTFREADTIRFLEQATFGPTPALITQVQQIGTKAWLAQQFATPSSGWNPFFTATGLGTGIPNLVAGTPIAQMPDSTPGTCGSFCQTIYYSMYPLQRAFFTKALYQPDQLRQRVVWALHQMHVISGRDITQSGWVQPYLEVLDRNAFGNFRTLLYEITRNAGMGHYLNTDTNTKNNPNENYAREINQLFSVGLYLVNPDGSLILDGVGNPIPTYTQTMIDNFTLVFTGTYIPNVTAGTPDYRSPMGDNQANHNTGLKTLYFGYTLATNQLIDQDLNQAIDNIFNHPNVGPFVAQHFIHQLVTSNPSPGYVERVSNVFDNDGTGTRGNLQAVITAVLLDPEARGNYKNDPLYGQLKEPALLMTQILRAFDAKACGVTTGCPNGATNLSTFSDGYFNGINGRTPSDMGQDILRPPTVFNYYPADFVVPGTTNVLGPEFGVLGATEVVRRANFVNTIVFSGIGTSTPNAPQGTALNFGPWALLVASNPPAFVAELNRVLMHNAMSAAMQTTILNAVSAVPATNSTRRVQQALYLVATSPQFQVKR